MDVKIQVIVPFPPSPENLQEFIFWCKENLGKMGRDWDLRPYNKDHIEIDLNKDDLNLIVQLKLMWG